MDNINDKPRAIHFLALAKEVKIPKKGNLEKWRGYHPIRKGKKKFPKPSE
jgi:hypothetical protein